jgi:hypothetical protein
VEVDDGSTLILGHELLHCILEQAKAARAA